MQICPYCQLVNPQHHNFCQSCGKSLKHYICRSCGYNVKFEAQSCPQCQASSGTYWWAILEPTVERLVATEVGLNSTAIGRDELPDRGQRSTDFQLPISADLQLNSNALQAEISGNPGDLSVAVLAPVKHQPDWKSPVPLLIDDDLETSPWDRSRPDLVPMATDEIAATPDAAPTFEVAIASEPSIVTTYLDLQCRYKLLDPVVLQRLPPGESSQVRVIDCQPLCHTLLEILMEQEPVTLVSTPESMNPQPEMDTAEPPGTPPIVAAYRQWQFWNKHGIPKVAQAYIALQVSLPGTIPAIRDSWNKDGQTVTIVEDRSDWQQLIASWNDPQISPSQTIYWLDSTLKLWVALEPWQMRQSLLEVTNLLLDEDGRICFQRLHPEPEDRLLELADLAMMWQRLFDESSKRIQQRSDDREMEFPRPAALAISDLLQSIHDGELERVEEVRSRLQQIAYELEPKQLSAPLLSASGDLSSPQDAPTIAIAQTLIDLEDAAATHVGKKRDHNEDCFGIVSRIERQNSPKGNSVSARGVYILCDGMGGHDGGEIASAMTVDILRDYFATRWSDNTLPDEQTIREGIVAANEAVFEINQKKAAHGSGRMGTTLVLVLVQDQNIAVAHVGDSRCYGITPSQGLIQLTLDHEVGQQQILRGVDPDIAYGRPDSYQLTQAIGPRDRNYIAPDIRFFELQEDTLIVLASDGLTDNQLLESYWLTNVAPLLSNKTNLQDGVDRLIDFANEYNGHDNITALVVRAKLG
ncbi:serine/threonine phosphatase [Chamaesiphon sp. OTE_8_metabat_110]|uniref:serine/threonine phosphatase n=1 Tax=Chamaesiphon sp. OTE_8_metabat_110 TaxID=2964696 RepID=UPI00286AAAD4|nr:serine/threonine phosphatase [Chamaesiphon sp. OTE_8_metabat_110]